MHIANCNLRNCIRDSPTLYSIFIKSKFSRSLRLPHQGTDIVIEGFPRSGNTFARYHVEVAFPDLKLASHVHTRASLKRSLEYQIPRIILLREPVSAVASFCMKYAVEPSNIDGIKRALKDYKHFYSFVDKSRNSFELVNFEDLIRKPECFLRIISKKLTPICAYQDLAVASSAALELMQARERRKDKLGSSLPHPARNITKQHYIEQIKIADYEIGASRLYEELTENCICVN